MRGRAGSTGIAMSKIFVWKELKVDILFKEGKWICQIAIFISPGRNPKRVRMPFMDLLSGRNILKVEFRRIRVDNRFEMIVIFHPKNYTLSILLRE